MAAERSVAPPPLRPAPAAADANAWREFVLRVALVLVTTGGFHEDSARVADVCAGARWWTDVVDAVVDVGRGRRRRTSLMAAAHFGDAARVAFLLSCGADIALADADGCTALHYAAGAGGRGSAAIVELLVGRAAAIDATSGVRAAALAGNGALPPDACTSVTPCRDSPARSCRRSRPPFA